MSISRRLADPSLLPRAGSPCSGYSSPALSFAGFVVNWEKCQLIPTQRMVYLSSLGLNLFQGFACPQKSREASLNWRRIIVLRRAAGVILAGASRSSVFNDSSRSGREASDAVASVYPASILGSGRPVCSGSVDSRGSLQPGVVARSSALVARYSAQSGVPSA